MSLCRACFTKAVFHLLLFWLLAICCPAQTLLTTVTTGYDSNPVAIAINPVTNRVYVANQNSSNVTVINGATNQTATVLTGAAPAALAVNPNTNKIYVADANSYPAEVTVIDGATNQTASVGTGAGPWAVAINAGTNKIYVANYDASSVTVIDGTSNLTSTINLGTRAWPVAIAVNSATNMIFVADNNGIDVINGDTDSVATIALGAAPCESTPCGLAVNPLTNQIYVGNRQSNTVSVIDGSTYSVTNVPVGATPVALAVDPVRNLIFVANNGTNYGTIIDGATLNTTNITIGSSPIGVDVDSVTSKAYFANNAWASSFLTMYDEVSGATNSVLIGDGNVAGAVAVNAATDVVYVLQPYPDNDVAVVGGGPASGLQFVPVTPCRVTDTRGPQGPFGGPYLSSGTSRDFPVPQSACSIPSTATAYSLNVTVVPLTGSLNYLTIWPAGETQPVVSTLNSYDGRVKANAAIVPAGVAGAVSVYVTDSTDVILDINGYFQPPSSQTLQFYPVPLCRVFDTRRANGDLGGPYLQEGQERDFPVLASDCQIPPNALAYSMNFTVVPVASKPLGYLTLWPAGSPMPVVSTLNNPTATTLANAAIVPVGANGAIAAYADQDTQLIGDINGVFAAPGTGGLSLYPLVPCRVIDTRTDGGAFSGERNPPVNIAASSCGIAASAQEYVFNATVVPIGSLGYLTLWADGDPMPGVSNLNATDGMAASNMAIIANHDGESDAYAYGLTQLILDIASYFAP